MAVLSSQAGPLHPSSLLWRRKRLCQGCLCNWRCRAILGMGPCTSSEGSICGFSLLPCPGGPPPLHSHSSSRFIFQEASPPSPRPFFGGSWFAQHSLALPESEFSSQLCPGDIGHGHPPAVQFVPPRGGGCTALVPTASPGRDWFTGAGKAWPMDNNLEGSRLLVASLLGSQNFSRLRVFWYYFELKEIEMRDACYQDSH